ncbi:hypothetical protein [Methylomonas methanica]|uniref:Uncharacterized protein n=1 Tax=Methylomonas methanica (strain DSM 25384 / MC09) TaxID=857087 RepID=G0A5K4_METMM|nr:hypothetical protein [Methylomonas methanica]AEG02861.1 hypothetical protein Metme_4521 [Methylomonas methanica MC09]
MLEAKIKFFDIKKCGFYLRGNNQTEFSGLSDTLQKLSLWGGDGREFVNTTTYEADPDNNLRNTYFCNWHRNDVNGDSILILWNEVPNDNGVIYGMNPMDRPGNTSMLTTGFGNTPAIPGFPSYFWFVPERNVFATIRFNHSVQGKKNLDHFLNGFLANKSPYRVVDKEGTVVGYSANGQLSERSGRVHSKFHALGRKQEELEAELLTNLHKIRRIIKRETLQYTVEDDRRTLERVFSGLLGNTPTFNQARTISHELQFEPTEQQLRQIINNYAELNSSSSIRNAGFIYNDGKRVMLNGANVAFVAEINTQREENQIVTPQSLLTAITSQRQALLRPLDQPAFEIEEAVAQ